MIFTLLAQVEPVVLPESTLVYAHASKVPGLVEAFVADCCRVIVSVLRVEVALVNSFVAHVAVHVLEVVHLLRFVLDRDAFLPAHHVEKGDLLYFLLALRARVFHLLHPLLDAWVAIHMLARVQLRLKMRKNLLQADAASFELLLCTELRDRLSVVFHRFAQPVAGPLQFSLVLRDNFGFLQLFS